MTIAVRRSGFTIPLSLVVLTSTAMLLAGCQSGGASNANQQGTTGSSSSAKVQSTASAKATSGQKSGHASPRIPSPTGKGAADSSASQPSGSQSRPASPRASEPRPAASGNGAPKALASGNTDAPGRQNGGASKAPQSQGKADDGGKNYAGATQAPRSATPEAQQKPSDQTQAEKQAKKPADTQADKPADKPADAQADKPADKQADKGADKPADAQADKPADKPADAQAPAEPAAPADEQPGQATSFVPGNLVSEKTAMIVSPSGNIGCDLSAHYAGCGVLSYRSNGTYGKDEAGSPKWWFDLSSGGTPQLAGRSEGAFSLDEAFRGGGSSPQVVEYGQSVTFGSWVCSSEETGMTCRNTETGHGVFLSSGRYETF